jgi:hypothetical protein
VERRRVLGGERKEEEGVNESRRKEEGEGLTSIILSKGMKKETKWGRRKEGPPTCLL